MGIGVSWRVVAASAAGTTHISAGRACEDSYSAQVHVRPGASPVLSMFVADGAGSASHGGEGAAAAVEAAARFVAEACTPELDGKLARQCIVKVRRRLYTRAAKLGLAKRDFACTFLGLLSSPSATLLMQVGDGGIVVDVGAGPELPIAPVIGEYANMTSFVTDEDALDVLTAKRYPGPANRVAMFSDGLQRLALDLATLRPHGPFFERLFQVLGTAGDGKDAELQAALLRFLTSPAVNARTDDDKTLALAVLVA